MPWHETFRSMREISSGRDWVTFRELVDGLVCEGLGLVTAHQVRKAIAGVDPPQKVYGMYRYTTAHVDAVRAFAVASRAITEEV